MRWEHAYLAYNNSTTDLSEKLSVTMACTPTSSISTNRHGRNNGIKTLRAGHRHSFHRLYQSLSHLLSATVCTIGFVSFLTAPTGATKTDNCEYNLDFTHNTIKIVCEGSPSLVNIYADQATLQADQFDKDNTYNQQILAMYQKSTTTVPVGSKPDGGKTNRKPGESKPHSNPSENQNSAHQNPQGFREPEGVQKDFQEMASKYSMPSPFADVVWNASQKLEMAKRSLSTYSDSIRNISTQLAEGDLNLRSDMEKLRRTSNSATDLKEGIIAALRNQYNFMRSALLTRNYELERLVTSMKVLIDVTSDGLHSALRAHESATQQVSYVNDTLLIVRKMVTKELRRRHRVKKGKKGTKKGRKALIKDECPKQISAIGSADFKQTKWPVGAYMVESVNPNDYRPVYVMKGSGPTDQLMEFDAPVDVGYGLVGRYIAFPFFCSGTGHAVYRRHFYCHKADTNRVVKYHLKRMDIIAEVVLPGAGYGNTYPYLSGENTDIDLAVDEFGLWAIYASHDSAGKMVITKIDHQHMEVEKTWMTSYPKGHIGNAFMICGVLYATNSDKDTPTFIRYVYNTETNKGHVLEPGELPFANSALIGAAPPTESTPVEETANSVMLNYDLRTGTLYSWSNGRIESYPVYFKESD